MTATIDAATRAAADRSGRAQVWVLLNARVGDNRQLLAIAHELGLPFRAVQLRFGPAAGLPLFHLLGSRLGWSSDVPLEPPWPRIVLAAGRKSVAAALWIRRRSAGATRLVHVNRPWAPLSWFDLVVTTPQYLLPPRANVVANLMPFQPVRHAVDLPAAWHERAGRMPRPWTLVLVGGDSRPWVLDDAAARAIADVVGTRLRDSGGSAWVLASPRTPGSALALIGRALEPPAQMIPWSPADNPYAALWGLADRFIVTADSASMLAEALASGKPVQPVALSLKPDWRWRLASAWRARAERAPQSWVARCFEAAVASGVLASVRDLARMQQAYEDAGVFAAPQQSLALAASERRQTLTRIEMLLDGVPRARAGVACEAS